MDAFPNKFDPIELSSFDIRYKKALDSLIRTESKLTFNNSGPAHASIVISNIFKHSDDLVRIYANNMNGEISKIGDYLKGLEKYLSLNKKLHVILDSLPQVESPAFEKVKSSINENVRIKISTRELKREVAFRYNPNSHFITGDQKMFRLEYDNFEHQALCGFNNTNITKTLIKLFDKYFKNCIPIDI